jgi:hypothetical protein
MNAHQSVKVDERTAVVLHAANTWGYNFILFALLIDIMYRSMVFHEPAWDLFALLGVSGAISTGYLAWHKVMREVFVKRMLLIMAITALFAFVLAAFLAATKAM